MDTEVKESIVFVKDFLNDYFRDQTLNEQINSLKVFNFEILENDKNYGQCTTRNFDCDDTSIARHIFFLIWNDSKKNEWRLPHLKSVNDIGSGCKDYHTGEEYIYRGETINTYATLLGNHNNGYSIYFENPSPYEKILINNFRKSYLTIGNFMILPEKSCNGTTFNTMRGGTSKYHDFFDLFLYALYKTKDFDSLKIKNDFYFNQTMSIEKFACVNYLDMFFHENTPKIIFQHKKFFGRYYTYYWWMRNKKTDKFKQNYRKFVIDYIERANSIIASRANIMCAVLQKLLESR